MVFSWTPQAAEAFKKLKNLFASAPVRIQPDPNKQFIVDVDAFDTGVGAVLSQVSGSVNKTHPCAFFFRRLSPRERNYNVGDRELLAIKLALEEWRHWLEGAVHPVLVWTDHKNLAYLKSAKRLNPRQSRWSLFFSRFNLTISFRPGSRNVKPDALSRIHSPDDVAKAPATILLPSCTVAAVTWEIEDLIKQAQQSEPTPESCPPDKIYVPTAVRTRFIHWIHSSAHLGISRTIALINCRFWWSSVHKDIRDYMWRNFCSAAVERSEITLSTPSAAQQNRINVRQTAEESLLQFTLRVRRCGCPHRIFH